MGNLMNGKGSTNNNKTSFKYQLSKTNRIVSTNDDNDDSASRDVVDDDSEQQANNNDDSEPNTNRLNSKFNRYQTVKNI